MKRYRAGLFNGAFVAMIAIALALFMPSIAESDVTAAGMLNITISQGKLVTLDRPATTVFVADPTIANVQVPLPNKVFVFGIKAGRTTVYALDSTGAQLASFLVVVHNDTTAVEQSLLDTPDTSQIHAASTQAGILLRGTAPTPDTAAAATASATSVLGDGQKLSDETHVRDSPQVMIQVRFAEVSRSVVKDLGVNWFGQKNIAPGNDNGFGGGFASGRQAFTTSGTTSTFNLASSDYSGILSFGRGNGQISLVLDALAQEGLVSVLAEPNLTTVSGQPASFIAGGEFPIPIVSGSSSGSNPTTIEFKQYGVSLDFVPTVYASNHISMRIRPEVSQLTNAGAVTISGITVPALTVRRADTTVELGSGESFAIGGLLENTSSTTISRYPGLGDLPVLGALFRSSNFQHNESELIIIVTPYIVHPVDDPSKLRLPTDALRPATDVERLFLGRLTARPDTPAPEGIKGSPTLSTPRLIGDAGFDIE